MELKMKIFNGFNNILCAVYNMDTVVLFNCLASIAMFISYGFTYFAGFRSKFDAVLVMCGWLILILIANIVFAIKRNIILRKVNKNETGK
jgi:uncharacterized membrane protein YgaE (UPF0421/DUF939 family)